MNIQTILKRAFNIIFHPKDEWELIKHETATADSLFKEYACFMAALPAIAAFIGNVIFGKLTAQGFMPMPMGENLRWSMLSYALSLGSVYLLSYIIDYLAPWFGAQKNLVSSLKIVVYSHTATWVVGILLIIPHLTILSIFGSFYSLYLLYSGIKSLKNVPQGRMAGYFSASILASIILSIFILFFISFFIRTAPGA
jgi:hypothetical protein